MASRGIFVAAAVLALSCCAMAEPAENGVQVYPAAFFQDARPVTASDMVNRIPGFSFDDGKSARGYAGTAGNVLIDGQRPASKTDDLDAILSRIPASHVDRIEVIRGGAPGIDMHGQSVVANVILKHDDASQFVIDAQDHFWPDGHSVPTVKLEYTRRSSETALEGSLYLAGGYDDSVGKGFYKITDVASGTVKRWDAQSTGRGSGWGLTGAVSMPLFGGGFKANLAYSDTPWHDGNFYTTPGNDITILDRSGAKKGELGLHWSDKFGASELETLLLQRLQRDTLINTLVQPGYDARFQSRNNSGESIARATLRYTASPALSFETGLEGAFNFLNGGSTYAENGVAIPLPSANAHVEEKRGEVFGQATWKFAEGWMAEGGARFEYSNISETGDTDKSRSLSFPKPRLLVTWTPRTDMQVRFRYERIVGQLDFNNFVASSNLAVSGVNAGNPDIEPDRHTQYEISYQYDFWKKGSFVVKFMHDEVSGVVDNVPVTGASGIFDAPGNIGSGTDNQIDVNLTLPLDRIGIVNGRLEIVNHFSFTHVRDPETGTVRDFTANRPYKTQVTFTQDVESLKSTWGLFYYNCWDEQYFRLSEVRHRRTIPPYAEFWWEYKPNPEWVLQLAVNNWAPFGYQDVREVYAGPRAGLTPSEIYELKIKSQPTLHLKVRKTF